MGGLEQAVRYHASALLWVLAGLAIGWGIYVPLHEFLHAAACVASGGTVERLEISAVYGGPLWAWLFPFVVSGGEYAGRLSGFQCAGDLQYLVTDLGPFVLTILPGLWAVRRAARRGRACLFGFWLPFALAPFLSLTGDAYEIGSIAITQLPPWADVASRELLRGDDLFIRYETLRRMDAEATLWSGFTLASVAGLLWALATYTVAHWTALALGERPHDLGPLVHATTGGFDTADAGA
jgi:hypothetical protein